VNVSCLMSSFYLDCFEVNGQSIVTAESDEIEKQSVNRLVV
jgi:hypothetical protein